MATTRRTEFGTWTVRYRDPAGRQKRRTFKKHSEAQAFRSQVDTAILGGTYIDPHAARVTFGEWSTRWFETRTHLKPKTVAGYESLLRTHLQPRFGGTPLFAIDHLDVERFVADLNSSGLSPSRIRQAHQLLSAILKAAVRSKKIGTNPAEGVALPRSRARTMRFLDTEDVERLAAAVPDRYLALVNSAAYGGLRWAEMVGLKRRNVNLFKQRIHIEETLSEVNGKLIPVPPKNNRTRDVVLPRFVIDQLSHHLAEYVDLDPDALVFTTDSGTPLRSTNFRKRVWNPATEAAGLVGLRPHDLRHTAAALLISEGAHPRQVMEHLGHTNITTTMNTYGKVFPSDMDSLADRLDRRHRALSGATNA